MIKKLREIINKIRWFDNQFITFRKNETINSRIFFLVNLFYIFLCSILNFFYKKFFISFFLLFNKVSSIFYDKKINVDFVSNKTKKCFIIGNGPSLKRQDLLKLKEQDVFVCNNFAMCFKNINFNPKYYLLADAHGYFSKKKIDRRGDPNDIKYIFEKNINSTFLIPDFLKKNFLKTIHYKKNKFFFYKTFPISLEEYTQKNINFQKGIPWAFNSLLINIYIAIAMGYKKIYLLGADQDLYLKDSYCTELKKYYQNLLISNI